MRRELCGREGGRFREISTFASGQWDWDAGQLHGPNGVAAESDAMESVVRGPHSPNLSARIDGPRRLYVHGPGLHHVAACAASADGLPDPILDPAEE